MTAPTEPVESALALVDANELPDKLAAGRLLSPYKNDINEPFLDCATRILAAEVRRLRAELAIQPMIATETRVFPLRK